MDGPTQVIRPCPFCGNSAAYRVTSKDRTLYDDQIARTKIETERRYNLHLDCVICGATGNLKAYSQYLSELPQPGPSSEAVT